jgi:putative FmdB family regulatory protein
MPTYEYVCKNCGETLEVFQSFADKPLKKHKQCGGGELKKVFHARGIVFKGGGFYATDSKASSSAKPSDKPSDKPAEKKTDKSEAKSSTKTGAVTSSDD